MDITIHIQGPFNREDAELKSKQLSVLAQAMEDLSKLLPPAPTLQQTAAEFQLPLPIAPEDAPEATMMEPGEPEVPGTPPPAEKTTKKKTKKKRATKKVAAKDTNGDKLVVPDISELRSALGSLMQTAGAEQVTKVLAEFKAERMSQVQESDRAEAIAKAKELVELHANA